MVSRCHIGRLQLLPGRPGARSRYLRDFSSLMLYSSTSEELSLREGKWTQSTRRLKLLSLRTRNI